MSKLQKLANKKRENAGMDRLVKRDKQESGVLGLLAKRRAAASVENSDLAVDEEKPSLLNKLSQRKEKKETIEIRPDPLIIEKFDTNQIQIENNDIIEDFQQIPIPTRTKRLADSPSHILSQILMAPHMTIKKPKIHITNVDTVKPKVKFKPKPVITKVADDVSNLTIGPKVPKVTKPKTKISDSIIESKRQTPTLSFITIGHVDSGKSTTLGRFLYDLEFVSSHHLHTLTKEAKEKNKASFSLAWIMDQTPEERSRGITVDTVQTGIQVGNRKFVLVDSPGHGDYLSRVVMGVSSADVAVVMIDSSDDLIFNLGSINDARASKNTVLHTREQVLISKALGITKFLFLVNKLDNFSSEEADSRFDTISKYLEDTLYLDTPEGLGFKHGTHKATYLPVSGFRGDNIVKPSTEWTWNSMTMLSVLESWWDEIAKQKSDQSINYFQFTTSDIISSSSATPHGPQRLKDNNLLLCGRVQSGMIQPGETIVNAHSLASGIVDSIWSASENTVKENVSITGEFVELLVKVDDIGQWAIGDTLGKLTISTAPKISSLKLEKEKQIGPNIFAACVRSLILDIETFELDRPLLVGTPLMIFMGPKAYEGRISSVEWQIVLRDDKLRKKKVKHLGGNSHGRIKVVVDGVGVLINNGEVQCPVVLRGNSTIGGGKLVAVE